MKIVGSLIKCDQMLLGKVTSVTLPQITNHIFYFIKELDILKLATNGKKIKCLPVLKSNENDWESNEQT